MPFVLKNYSAITENSTKIRSHDIIEHFLKNIRNLKKKIVYRVCHDRLSIFFEEFILWLNNDNYYKKN